MDGLELDLRVRTEVTAREGERIDSVTRVAEHLRLSTTPTTKDTDYGWERKLWLRANESGPDPAANARPSLCHGAHGD